MTFFVQVKQHETPHFQISERGHLRVPCSYESMITRVSFKRKNVKSTYHREVAGKSFTLPSLSYFELAPTITATGSGATSPPCMLVEVFERSISKTKNSEKNANVFETSETDSSTNDNDE